MANQDLVHGAVLPSRNDSNENHVAGDVSDKGSIEEEHVEENSDGALTVTCPEEDTSGSETVAKRLQISEKIKNRRPTPWPADQLESLRSVREAYGVETETIEDTDRKRRRVGLLAGDLRSWLQKLLFMIPLALSRSAFSAASQFAASHAIEGTYEHAGNIFHSHIIREMGGGASRVQFVQPVRSVLPCTPPKAGLVYVIATTSLIVLVVWKFLFRQDTPWDTFLHVPVQWWTPRPGASPHRPRLNTSTRPLNFRSDHRDGGGN